MTFPGPHFPGYGKIPPNPFAGLSPMNGAIGSFLYQFVTAIGSHISISILTGNEGLVLCSITVDRQ
jgi:hypothetical protein